MITIIIVILTSIVSIITFSNTGLLYKFQLNPYQVYHRKQYYRILSHGFIHANWIHLIINMIVLFSFGLAVEDYFRQYFEYPTISFIILYFGSMFFATITTIKKQKDNHYYNAVGASGAVSAIVFTSIFFNPWSKVYFYGIIGIPGIIMGILYLLYSYYMSRKSSDNINHDAHFLGAVFGFVFPILLDFKLLSLFISRLLGL
jgi:membrane associated rhomboid family serine protease